MSMSMVTNVMFDVVIVEMPGLMSCRAEFGPSQPLKGARITGSLHMYVSLPTLLLASLQRTTLDVDALLAPFADDDPIGT
jgi:S-adenosylhomocysteine hydrolase